MPEYVGETANEWYERYLKVHAALKKNGRRRGTGSWDRWCASIDTLPMTAINPEHVKAIRNDLRRAALAEDISAKTAINLWSVLITAPFSRAFTDEGNSNL